MCCGQYPLVKFKTLLGRLICKISQENGAERERDDFMDLWGEHIIKEFKVLVSWQARCIGTVDFRKFEELFGKSSISFMAGNIKGCGKWNYESSGKTIAKISENKNIAKKNWEPYDSSINQTHV